MCGLLTAINIANKRQKTESVNEWILNQYQDQYTRGQKGFGIILIDKKNKVTIKRATEPLKFLLDLNTNESEMILAHHRTPTSTENKIKQTHPIVVKHKSLKHDYLVIHNGIISNDDLVKEMHEKLGFIYTTETEKISNWQTFNDSEAVAIEAVRFIEKQTPSMATSGSMAVIALQINKKTNTAERLFFCRDGNPLNMSKTRGKLRLSSEGEGNPIEEDIMYNCELKGEMKLLKKTITYNALKEPEKTIHYSSMGYGGYDGKGYSDEDEGFGSRHWRNTSKKQAAENSKSPAERSREEEIEDTLNNEESIDLETMTAEERFGEYLDQEVDNIEDHVKDFALELNIKPEEANIENTITLITEVLERMKDTVLKSNELFGRTIAQERAAREEDAIEEDTIKRVEYLKIPEKTKEVLRKEQKVLLG